MTPKVSIGSSVDTITLSPKYQVVIPKSIRERLKLRPGQKMQAIVYDNRIELQAVAARQQGHVADLSGSLALTAARLAVSLKMPMADGIMLATARAWEATPWTQDSDFDGVPGVRYVVKKTRTRD